MLASPARIAANTANAARSTGPGSPEGKERSRANSFKHGLTGEGVVLPEGDAAEVDRLERALLVDMRATGGADGLLIRRIAVLSVRMDRAADQEFAASASRIRKVMDEFEAPEGTDAATAEKLRVEAGQIAWFDPSKEACLARKYDAAAQRGFFRALDELRRLKREARAAGPAAVAEAAHKASREALGSFSRLEKELVPAEARAPKPAPYSPPKAPDSFLMDDFSALDRRVDVPITIGRRH